MERSIDEPGSPSPTGAKTSQPDSKRDRASALETTERHRSHRQPSESSDLAPQLDRSPSLTREAPRAITAPSVTRGAVDPSPSSTGRGPNQQALPTAEPPLQNMHVEVRPVENLLDVAETLGTRSKTPFGPDAENWLESRFGKLASNHALHSQGAKDAGPTPTERSSNPIKPSSPSADQGERGAQSPSRAIDIGEKPLLDEWASGKKSRLEPPTRSAAASSSNVDEGRSSKASPVIAQTRIAPLAEAGPDGLSLKRHGVQSEPTVHVTIGRIEIRAVQSSQSAAKPRATAPMMNLDDYLRRRDQAGAR